MYGNMVENMHIENSYSNGTGYIDNVKGSFDA